MSNTALIVFFIIITSTMAMVRAQNCNGPSTAVVVVASVFGTLAVVFLVLGIIACLLWRRRKGLSQSSHTPKKNGLQDDTDCPSPEGGLSNPAFSDAEISMVEQGVSYTPSSEKGSQYQDKRSPRISTMSDTSRKTWTSLPHSDLSPGHQRKGSVGSLDNGLMSMDSELTSVWLHSQDFIGLGFNISGSMRDGIYVSQVHNRGPAIESGKFKVGDRILDVTISFKNMVYEDALTILSYASPYPVKVTLQKQHGRHRRASNTPSILSHPLYRSQSMDTLVKIAKEPIFRTKRSMSEDKPMERKQLTAPKKISITKTNDSLDDSFLLTKIPEVKVVTKKQEPTPSTSEIIVHSTNTLVSEQEDGKKIISPIPTSDSPKLSTTSTSSDNKNLVIEQEMPPPVPTVPAPELQANAEDSSLHFEDVYNKLTEEDKMDVLRLSYEDHDPNRSSNSVLIVPSTNEPVLASLPGMDQTDDGEKTMIPNKPERRKKKSTSSEDLSGNGSSRNSTEIEEVIVSVITTKRSKDLDPVGIYEDMIVAERKDRDSSIISDKIELAEVSPIQEAKTDSPASVKRDSPNLVDYSLSEAENSIQRPYSPYRKPSVSEDVISAHVHRRDPLEVAMSHIFNRSKQSQKKKLQGHSGSDSSLDCSDDEKNKSKNESVNNSQDSSVVTDPDSSVLDLSLNSTPNLFSTPFPKRNQKEGQSGMSYDISMDELESIDAERQKRSKPKQTSGSGGIAFEVRDDFKGGVFRTVSIDSSTVVKKNGIQPNASDTSLMEWSGKRLVRSGSFTDIPQNDSVADWMDHNRDNDEEESTLVDNDNDSYPGSASSDENKYGLSRAKFFGARENLADLSDNSDCDDSSHQSTPPPPYNGDDNDSIINTTPTKTALHALSTKNKNFSTDQENNRVITDMSSSFEKQSSVTVSVDTAQEDDTEC